MHINHEQFEAALTEAVIAAELRNMDAVETKREYSVNDDDGLQIDVTAHVPLPIKTLNIILI